MTNKFLPLGKYVSQRMAEMGREAGRIEALAEQEKQEPVAYCCGFENTHPDGWIDCKIFRDGEFTTPLYAAPVSAKREWVDLTDDEINKLIQAWYKSNDGLFGYASAVIAAFKEKNK